MRFARRDVRDHIASQKNDHGASYPRYRALQRRSRPNINVCEISGMPLANTKLRMSPSMQRSLRLLLRPLLCRTVRASTCPLYQPLLLNEFLQVSHCFSSDLATHVPYRCSNNR
jgi:hypothetical protein